MPSWPLNDNTRKDFNAMRKAERDDVAAKNAKKQRRRWQDMTPAELKADTEKKKEQERKRKLDEAAQAKARRDEVAAHGKDVKLTFGGWSGVSDAKGWAEKKRRENINEKQAKIKAIRRQQEQLKRSGGILRAIGGSAKNKPK